MAEDLELEKNSPEDEAEEKPAKKAKSDDKKAAKKTDKNKKKKKGLIRFFKDSKAEFKKVVWPGPKETTRNTIVVVVVCLIAGVVVFGVDSLFGLLNNLLFRW